MLLIIRSKEVYLVIVFTILRGAMGNKIKQCSLNKCMENIEQRIVDLEARNVRVEMDKTWETSLTRKVLLVLFTYLAIGLYLRAIEVDRPWVNAIVPAVGFMISTLTMPFFKSLWMKTFRK